MDLRLSLNLLCIIEDDLELLRLSPLPLSVRIIGQPLYTQIYVVLGTELKAFFMLDKHSTN